MYNRFKRKHEYNDFNLNYNLNHTHSTLLTLNGTLAPTSPATFGRGKIEGCFSIFVSTPPGKANT